MKKKKITYGVWGMMEYIAVVTVGRRSTKIQFSDGSVSAMGVNPAKFTTDNVILQNAIESSDDFRRGLIKVVSVHELEGEVKVLRNKPKCAPELEPTKGSDAPTLTKCDLGVVSTPSDIAPKQEQTPAEEESQPGETEPLNHIEVEFANKEEARDYLVDTWGANRAKLRTREDIIAAAITHGVKLSFA